MTTKSPEAGTPDAREAAYDRSIRELFEGRTFARWSFPDPTARYHGGAVRSRSYANAMEAVARFAKMGDWAADVASAIFHGVNRYSTGHEVRAQISRAQIRAVVHPEGVQIEPVTTGTTEPDGAHWVRVRLLRSKKAPTTK